MRANVDLPVPKNATEGLSLMPHKSRHARTFFLVRRTLRHHLAWSKVMPQNPGNVSISCTTYCTQCTTGHANIVGAGEKKWYATPGSISETWDIFPVVVVCVCGVGRSPSCFWLGRTCFWGAKVICDIIISKRNSERGDL